MRVKVRNFPHPVLNPVSDDFLKGFFKGEIIEQTEENDMLEFNINLSLNNPDLQNLIQTKKVSFNIHFECNSTMQRLTFSEYQPVFKISIAKELLNKKVDVNFFILADQKIENYTNLDAHPDYAGVKFGIQKGDILAFSESQTIYIEKQPMSNTNSIFKVSKATDPKAPSISISLSENQIEIGIPEASYEKVGHLQAYGDDCNKILISMLYLPALIDTLFNVQDIARRDDYGLEEIAGLDWYRTLEKRLQKMGYNIAELNFEEITQISYDLLNSSSEAPLVSLENIIYNREGDDD
ncbi:hypothetical protein [Planococcus salinus]|uniref:Uncharacterized protein n=1 Tax=Planococcus salinus TaxID=1848460 RepID=A0A3M8P7T8_9BACL|nr:hypothetical protein [Planococcus salinus]RNF39758.1 hypothetical protein EEX84_07265 [Planococcus salinus]